MANKKLRIKFVRENIAILNSKLTTVRKIRIKFLSAHKGALNPGASEIAVFGASPGDKQLSLMLVGPDERSPESQILRNDLLAGRIPAVKQAEAYPDPEGAEKLFRELREKSETSF